MVQKEKSSSPNLLPAEFAEMGKKRVEDFVNVQTEFVEKLQEMNRQWFDRAQSEANLASELASKLTAARSIPDAMAAYQE
jgi:phasin protein